MGGVPGPSCSRSEPVISGASPTPSACKAAPTWPCSRRARSQRSASSSAEWAKGIAVPARATTRAASWERGVCLWVKSCLRACKWGFAGSSSAGIPSPVSCETQPGRTDDVQTLSLKHARRARFEPIPLRDVSRGPNARLDLLHELAHQAMALGDHVVLVDRLEILLAGGHEGLVAEAGEALGRHADHLPHAVLDEARPHMGLLHDLDLVRALHQLVDLGAHGRLDDLEQRLRLERLGASLGAADVQRADAALVVGGDGDRLEDAGDLVVGEAVLAQALLRALHHHLLRAGARGHALGLDADQPARAEVRRHGRAEQRVDLLRRHAGGGGWLVLRVARRDRDLGPGAVLTVAHALGDVGGERLRLEGLAEDDLVDRLVHDLLESRHVRALLLRPEVDVALELGVEELLHAVRADPDHLLDAGDPDAREAELCRGTPRLDVASEECDALAHGQSSTVSRGPRPNSVLAA